MNDKNIKDLMDKYWNSESTQAEEKDILEYMRSLENESEYQEERKLFNLFDAARHSDYFPQHIKYPDDKPDRKTNGIITMFMMPLRYAAVFLLGACCLWLITQFSAGESISYSHANQHQVEDPHEAMEITKDALMMVSHKLNKGKHETKKTLAAFNGINIMEYDHGY